MPVQPVLTEDDEPVEDLDDVDRVSLTREFSQLLQEHGPPADA
jgi:hypothetical protein